MQDRALDIGSRGAFGAKEMRAVPDAAGTALPSGSPFAGRRDVRLITCALWARPRRIKDFNPTHYVQLGRRPTTRFACAQRAAGCPAPAYRPRSIAAASARSPFTAAAALPIW